MYRASSTFGNLMYDKRVVRGNTYALHTLPAVSTKTIALKLKLIDVSLLYLQSSQPDPLELQRQQEARRRTLARKRAREQFKPRSPDAVEGRKHVDVQTELYLEEITGELHVQSCGY